MFHSSEEIKHQLAVLQAKRREFVGPLAQKLCKELSIKPGNELVPFLGVGIEASNIEAIETWTYQMCIDMKLPFNDTHFEMLVCILESAIEGICEELQISVCAR
ncbi:hypothetical protein C9975_06325 [Thalassospira xiamenensis]|nr:hypothetical protein C9975_06325 [Thalassospira xiamenensis]